MQNKIEAGIKPDTVAYISDHAILFVNENLVNPSFDAFPSTFPKRFSQRHYAIDSKLGDDQN